MVTLAQPNAEALIEAIVESVPRLARIDPHDFHARIADQYDWNSVAKDTLQLYQGLQPHSHAQVVREYRARCGLVFGPVFALLFVLDLLFLWLLRWLKADDDIERAPQFHCGIFKE
jgi:hypothetical protein